jgi:MFS family permease
VFTAAVFIGPIAGPIMGSFVVADDNLGWRWVFWLLMIFSAFCWVVAVAFLPETFAPVLLSRKVSHFNPTRSSVPFTDLLLST